MNRHNDAEILRRELLDEIYAGGVSGFDAMLLDEEAIRKANEEELQEIARAYGLKKKGLAQKVECHNTDEMGPL